MGVAVADTTLTFMLAVYTSWEFGGNVSLHFLLCVVTGEILHYLFGVQTAGMTMLGIKACSHTS